MNGRFYHEGHEGHEGIESSKRFLSALCALCDFVVKSLWKGNKMKSRIITTPLVAVALGCAFLIVSAQQSDDEVRGAFISTRPKTTNANAPARRHRPPPRNTNSSANTPRNSNSARNANSANANTDSANKNSTKTPLQPIALGYTMFMRDINGRA